MGKKSSTKGHTPPATPPPDAERSRTPLVVAGLVVVALAAGVLTYLRTDSAASAVAQQTTSTPPQPASIPAEELKAHPQSNLPPLQFPGYPMARSPEAVRAAYTFAAEHPEVLSYVPCFCGCEHSGHRGNEDCFVKARDINGDVVEWQDHGMECAVCLDVAIRAKQMYTSGASVTDIRAAIDKEWTGRSTNHTPTPQPPHHH